MEEVQQSEDFNAEILAGLWVAKNGAGKEARMEFTAAATEKFGHIPPAELERIWEQATATLGG